MTSPAILLAFSMAANLAGNLIRKYVNGKVADGEAAGHVYNVVTSFTAAILLFCLNGFGHASAFTILLGILFGIVTALQQLTLLQALKLGPLSYTMVLVSLSTLIPALCGAVLWHETLVLSHFAGIALMIGCFLLSVGKESTRRKATVRWLLYCGAAFLCSGGIGVMQKWHQNTPYRGELGAFLVTAFVFSTLYSVGGYFLSRRGENKEAVPSRHGYTPALLALVAAAGAAAALNNQWNLYLSGVMDSAVFFPIVNGGGLVLTTISALVLFRERLSRRQWVGMLLGVLSVLCLCIPWGG